MNLAAVSTTSTHGGGRLPWENMGKIPFPISCTPQGCVEMLDRSGVPITGKKAVVIGRSNIDGWAPRPPTRAQHAAARARLVTPARAAFAGSRWRCC